jgi:hypothetical protein
MIADAAAGDATRALGGTPLGTSARTLSKAELSRFLRREVDAHFFDDSGAAAEGTAIYWLADPRDIQQVRYVGQTSAPRRRFLQHLSTARLWLPDEKPWWVQSPKLRPLYEWIRALHRDELRLPVMVVSAWVNTTAQARLAERSRILDCLAKRLPLLNFEAEMLGKQMPLL